MDWDKLKIFHTVRSFSFTKHHYLSQPICYHRQIQFRKELKVQLFERHARGLVLTENGEYLFKSAHEIDSKLNDGGVKSLIKDKLDGKLAVTTVGSFGTTWLTPNCLWIFIRYRN